MSLRNQSERGEMHLFLVLVAIVAILIALAATAWMHFGVQNDELTVVADQPPAVADKEAPATAQYKSPKAGISFNYPADWTVTEQSGIEVSEEAKDYYLDLSVKDKAGVLVARLYTNTQIGGACGPSDDDKTELVKIASQPASSAGTDVKGFSYTIIKDNSGKYYISYGLSKDAQSDFVRNEDCPGMSANYSYWFNANNKSINSTVFALWYSTGGSENVAETRYFDTLDEAKAFAASDEFRRIKDMLLSLTIAE